MTLTIRQLQSIESDPRAFLSRGLKARELIVAKRERIEDWRRLAESVTITLRPDVGGGGGGYTQSLVENAVCNIIDLEHEITAEIEGLIAIQQEVACVITELLTDERHKAVIELRYLNGQSWKAIAARLYYGEDWICRLHSAALREVKAAASDRIKSTR